MFLLGGSYIRENFYSPLRHEVEIGSRRLQKSDQTGQMLSVRPQISNNISIAIQTLRLCVLNSAIKAMTDIPESPVQIRYSSVIEFKVFQDAEPLTGSRQND